MDRSREYMDYNLYITAFSLNVAISEEYLEFCQRYMLKHFCQNS